MEADKRQRVLLADDHRMVAEGLRKLLEPEVEVVGIAGHGRDLLTLTAAERPDAIVCGLSMTADGGFAAIRRLTADDPAVRVVILSAQGDAVHVREAFQAGARGYVLKSSAPDELLAAIGEVLAENFFASPAVTGHLVEAFTAPQAAATPVPADASDPAVDAATPIRVLIVDDDATFRIIARAHLDHAAGVEVAGEAEDGLQGVELAVRLEPDVILMDLRMPEMDGGVDQRFRL
ncbi:MAG: response regulator [Thermoanaerobaculia bacterium]